VASARVKNIRIPTFPPRWFDDTNFIASISSPRNSSGGEGDGNRPGFCHKFQPCLNAWPIACSASSSVDGTGRRPTQPFEDLEKFRSPVCGVTMASQIDPPSARIARLICPAASEGRGIVNPAWGSAVQGRAGPAHPPRAPDDNCQRFSPPAATADNHHRAGDPRLGGLLRRSQSRGPLTRN